MSSSVTTLLPKRLTIANFKAKVNIVSFKGMCSSTPKLDQLWTKLSESWKKIFKNNIYCKNVCVIRYTSNLLIQKMKQNDSFVVHVYAQPEFLGNNSLNGLDLKLECSFYACSFLRLCLRTVWISPQLKAQKT